MVNAIKRFEVWRASLPGGSYQIRVLFRGQEVEEFVRPTMKEAEDAFEAAGYDRIRVLHDDVDGFPDAYIPATGTW